MYSFQAFKTSALHRGVEYIPGKVVNFERSGESEGTLKSAVIMTNTGERVEAEFSQVVIAAGGDSGEVNPMYCNSK